MKRTLVLIFSCFVLTFTLTAQSGIGSGVLGKPYNPGGGTLATPQTDDEEITLFNSHGKATAYIASNEGLTIYMWGGKPVAYLYQNNGEWNIYGFNGTHLGWFEKGIIYDHEGYAVGFIKGAANVATEYEPYKSYKEYKPYKSYKQYAPYKPYLSNSFSSTPLSIFLYAGAGE